MALSIKTAEADELARSLTRLTGESMTEAVTIALRERLARERARRQRDGDLIQRLSMFAERIAPTYDARLVTKEEWDAAVGDEG